MRRSFFAALLLPAVLALAACSVSTTPGGDSAKTGAAQSGPMTIGFSNATQQSPFYVVLGDNVKKAAEAEGAKINYVDANGDINKQNKDIQDLITKKVSVLLINPVNPQGIAPSLAAAKSAGIPVLTVDQPANGVDTFVGRNNVAMSKLVGEAVGKALGNAGGKVIAIQGAAGSIVTTDRMKGFESALRDNSKVNLIVGPNADYVRSKAVSAMQDLLQANPDVKAVYAENDDMAMGALQVLAQNNRTDVKVAGVDGLMEAVKAIANGDQYVATAMNDPAYEGMLAAQTALKIAKGEKAPAFVDAGTTLLTKDNAKEYVSSALFAVTKK